MDKAYSAGNLELSILGYSEGSVQSIYNTVKALRRLASVVDKIYNSNFAHAGQSIEYIFSKIASATNSINTQNLQNLASAAKSLSSLTKISKIENLDFEKIGNGFQYLATAITPFINKIKEAETSLQSLNSIMNKTGRGKIPDAEDKGTSQKSKLSGIFNIAKWTVILHTVRKLGRYMGDLVQAGSDYMETLNLWQVAMRNNLDAADEFINKMQKAYGISSKTLMNAQATFKNMIGSLGQISEATSYALSEALVQMTADYASLYNRTFKSAIENMQSMLAGQVRPIRAAGLDITETTLYQFYQELGGTKSMRQLNRTEKQLLSILAVYRQMGSAGALGDMSKTVNQFANQSRMLTENWAELKVWTGLVLKDLIESKGWLTTINAALITIREIVKGYAKSLGIGEENFLTGLFETAENTNYEIDELQGKLLDFDKFRSLEGQNQSILSIDEKVIEAITGYSSKVDDANNKAQELANTWLTQLGVFKEIDGQLVYQQQGVDKILETVKSYLSTIGAIAGVIVSYKLVTAFKALGDAIEGFGKISKVTLGISLLITLVGYAYVTNEKFRTSINNIIGTLVKTVLPVLDLIVNLVSPILEAVSTAITFLDEIGLLEVAIWAVVFAFIALNSVKIVGWFSSVITGIGKFITSLKLMNLSLNLTSATLTTVQYAMFALGAAFLMVSFSNFLNTEMSSAQRVITIFIALAAAIGAAAVALKLLGMNWAGALGVAGMVAGTVFTISSAMPSFEAGASDIDSGTVFRAGENGKTEAIYTASNGKTNVANVKQMEQAFYNALARHSANGNGTIVAELYLDGEKVYQNTTAHASSRGYGWSKKS